MSLNSGTVVSLSVLLGVTVYVVDLAVRLWKARGAVSKEQRDSLREPIEIRGTILDNTRDAVALQSALMLDLREEIKRLRSELDMKDAELAETRKQVQAQRMEIARLYTVIGKYSTGMPDNTDSQ
jgi:hypothetical protein